MKFDIFAVHVVLYLVSVSGEGPTGFIKYGEIVGMQ